MKLMDDFHAETFNKRQRARKSDTARYRKYDLQPEALWVMKSDARPLRICNYFDI